MLDKATPNDVRFIKLGRKSAWWPLARDTNTLRLGFRQFDFTLSKAGKWEAAKKKFAALGLRKGAGDITRAVNQAMTGANCFGLIRGRLSADCSSSQNS